MQLLLWLCLALERRINEDEVHNFVENLSEVAHLILHDFGVQIVAVEAKHTKLSLQFLLEALSASTSRQVEAAEHFCLFVRSLVSYIFLRLKLNL